MKKQFMVLGFFLLLLFPITSSAQFDDLIKGVKGALSGDKQSSSNLSNDQIAAGLKEALNVGTGNAVDLVSKIDGFYGNDLIKILLPSELQTIEKTARQFGLGSQFDEMILSMNRAAETASKSAAPIFIDAIKEMTITDALNILNGKENEATLYFKDKTEGKLTDLFKPIVTNAMNQVGVTKTYKDLTSNIKSIPFVSVKVTDIDQYVTSKTLDGLYTMIAKEEKNIRENPSARINDILKDVFGSIKP
ncbi:MAG: hypothetical protein CMF23_02490 [Ignavibacteriae bacterium]|mgnify:CR=1 FL=1|nr:hypothetical protein [Ignavibacteriota bacterium]|tara:strand:+ start:807 stop:1550 length:744 start_codon:yes stop_codon:yes gene_type:complete